MIRLYRHPVSGCAALLLCFLMLLPAQGADSGENRFHGLFNWAKKHYMEGKYRETANKLDILLTYMGKQDLESIAKIHLLRGAAFEKMGHDKKQLKEVIEGLQQWRALTELYPGGYLPVKP